jgi:hypothetical protein
MPSYKVLKISSRIPLSHRPLIRLVRVLRMLFQKCVCVRVCVCVCVCVCERERERLYLLSPWSRVLSEMLVRTFPPFYGTRRFITAFPILSQIDPVRAHIPLLENLF